MTDESFPFMRWRMLALICCHVSSWLKGVFVRELTRDKQKRGGEKWSDGVRGRRGDFGTAFLFPAIKWSIEDSQKLFHACMNAQHDRWCVFITESIEGCSTPAPTVHSFHDCKAVKPVEMHGWNMDFALPRAVGFLNKQRGGNDSNVSINVIE